MAGEESIQDIEITLLLEAIHRRYGYDFREYASPSIRRRILAHLTNDETVKTVSGLQERVLHDPAFAEKLLASLTIHTTSMFRDPEFYVAFRRVVVPMLRTYPFTRIWHAGCSTGEEVYSMAIMLAEEGLYERTRIYATDISDAALKKAREGIFELSDMQEYTTNYLRAGGKSSFSEYYTAAYDSAMFRPWLRENVIFAAHNLAADGVFNEFQVVACRNVMIYFNKALQERVHKLLHESLVNFGVLALGKRESLKFTSVEHSYEVLDESEKLFKKVR